MELRKVQVIINDGYPTIDNNGNKIYVPAKTANGYFHCWEHYKNYEISEVLGLIELEDGTVQKFDVNRIKFLDKPE